MFKKINWKTTALGLFQIGVMVIRIWTHGEVDLTDIAIGGSGAGHLVAADAQKKKEEPPAPGVPFPVGE